MTLTQQYVRGQRFNPTASDANRLLKKALEADQGAANLTSSELRTALQLGHVLIKNNTGGSLDRFSVVGLGDRLYPFRLNQQRLNLEINAWKGETLDIKRHFFHHAVIQQSAAHGEFVRAAIDGVTFCRQVGSASPSETEPLTGMALHKNGVSSASHCMEAAIYGRHAKCLAPADTNSASEDNPALILLGDISQVWPCVITSRTDDDTLVGYLEQWGSGGIEINVEDRYDLLPSTTDLATGSISSIRVAVEIAQASTDADIYGVLLTIPRTWATLGLSAETP